MDDKEAIDDDDEELDFGFEENVVVHSVKISGHLEYISIIIMHNNLYHLAGH